MEIINTPAETTTVGYEAWKQDLKEVKKRIVDYWVENNEIDPDNVMYNIANCVTEPVTWLKSYITAYMTEPVAYYNGRPIEARTTTNKSITDLQMEFMDAIAQGKNVFVYRISYHGDRMALYTNDSNWNEIPLGEPKCIPGYWSARYTII